MKSYSYLVWVLFAALLLGCVTFRPHPDIRGSKAFEKGDIVKKIGEKDSWVHVESPDGKVGWIHNALAEPIVRGP